jgi:hypothetical protein
MWTKSAERPFESNIILLLVLILDKIVIFLIDRIVCQMHELIVFIYLLGVGLTGKSSQTLLVYIHSQWLIWGYEYINAQIKLVAVDEKWIRNVPWNNWKIIILQIFNIVEKMNTTTSTEICWLDNPNILLRLFLCKHLIMGLEFSKLVRENIGIRDDIINPAPSKLLLHLHNVVTKSVLSGNFIAWRKMIDSLIFVQTFI